MPVAVSIASRSVLVPSASPSKIRSFTNPLTPRLKGRGVFVCLQFFLLFCSSLPAGASDCRLADLDSPHSPERVSIRRVVDGDTVTLTDGRRVRLIGINTPELHGDDAPQPLSRQARARLQALVAKDTVKMVTGREDRDNHRRTLGYLFDSEGRNLASLLLAEGLGWHVAIAPNLGLAPCLAAVESRARQARRGVWQYPATAVADIHGGGFHRVRGRLSKITFATTWWLSLEGRVVARIPPRDQRRFDRRQLAGLQGRILELQGWIYPSHSNKYEPWRINLYSPLGLRVVSEP